MAIRDAPMEIQIRLQVKRRQPPQQPSIAHARSGNVSDPEGYCCELCEQKKNHNTFPLVSVLWSDWSTSLIWLVDLNGYGFLVSDSIIAHIICAGIMPSLCPTVPHSSWLISPTCLTSSTHEIPLSENSSRECRTFSSPPPPSAPLFTSTSADQWSTQRWNSPDGCTSRLPSIRPVHSHRCEASSSTLLSSRFQSIHPVQYIASSSHIVARRHQIPEFLPPCVTH